MSTRSLAGVLPLLALLAFASGCVRAYRPPTLDEPHATLKLRRTYQTAAGKHLRETVTLDEHVALDVRDPAEMATTPRTDAMLAHPTAAELEMRAVFSHPELHSVQEYYTVQVPYSTTESYSCGSGTSPQTCTRSVMRTRSESRSRMVSRWVDVPDATCAARRWIAPRASGTYLLAYDYQEDGVCRIACYEQVASGEPGAFDNRPCTEPTPEEKRRAIDAR